ncbi:MAG: outer membrane protein assembly factor BamD [Acidobacteria bacterium]|nr:outer membrane protein assembly factor BamD [Acidobacteriota bacterium]
MKRTLLVFSFVILLFSLSAFAQTKDGNKEPELSLDQVLDIDANHNLDVAWQAFKSRKAYKAVLMRTDETMAAHPTFSKMDEILYLAGVSSYYLLEGKGKQKIDLSVLSEEEQKRYAPEKLKEDSVVFLKMLIGEHPESKYKKDAEKILKKLETDKN